MTRILYSMVYIFCRIASISCEPLKSDRIDQKLPFLCPEKNELISAANYLPFGVNEDEHIPVYDVSVRLDWVSLLSEKGPIYKES